MKRNQRIFAALLAVLCAGSCMLASCGDATAGPKTTDPIQNDTSAVSDAIGTETEMAMPVLPEKDYNGYEFTFLTSSDQDENGVDWVTKDIYAEASTGDIITDAVYARNLWLEDQFHIKVKEKQGVTLQETKKAVQAGVDDYDAVITNFAAGCTLASGNYVLDLREVPYIDLTQPWWDQGLTRDTSIAGRTYIATGDITIMDNEATWVMMFNKAMAQSLDYDFYKMVENNTWDMETFYNCAKTAEKDLNGDGKHTGPDDQFGFATSDVSATGLIYASGVALSSKNADDYPTLGTNLEQLTSVVEKAGEIMSDSKTTIITGQNGITSSDELRLVFESGRALFFGEVMACVTRMRESKTDFGLIPFPKYDAAQDGYYHMVHRSAGKGVCIPSTQADTEMAGIILEAMAAKSVSTVTAAYYDKAITYKYMRDEESAKMLDIILSSRVYDLAYIYDWGSIVSSMNQLVMKGKSEVSSTWDKKIKTATKQMQKTIDAFQENE